jgi:lipopolysaccharide export system ATP-binding protein
MLKINNISKAFKDKKIVSGISFEVNAGDIYGLLGPNGAGKTTTFYIIAGLLSSDRGQIILSGEDISAIPMHQRSKRGIKYLPQEPSIFQNLSVYENLYGLAELSFDNKRDIEIFIDNSMEEFNLSKISDLKGRQLSGGQRRKVEIARTLAAEPKIILLDEPFAGIDPIALCEIKELVAHLKDKGVGVLITDHNVRETMGLIDRAVLIHEGSVLIEGKPEDIIKNDDVRRVYLGERFSI